MEEHPAAELAGVTEPWCRTRPPDADEPSELLTATPEAAHATMRSLTALLATLAAHRAGIAESYRTLPDAFHAGSWLGWRADLDDVFARITDASPAAVQAWMAEHYDPARIGMAWTAPPPDFAAAAYWAYVDGFAQERIRQIVEWLEAYHGGRDLPEERRALLALLARYVPRLADVPASRLVLALGELGRREALPFLEDLAAGITAGGHTRAELDRVIGWVRGM